MVIVEVAYKSKEELDPQVDSIISVEASKAGGRWTGQGLATKTKVRDMVFEFVRKRQASKFASAMSKKGFSVEIREERY